MTDTIQKIADELVDKLLRAGFKLQRYDSYSTSSVYLKLDYGIGNSIRIADHKCKKHLHYRYNLLINKTGYSQDLSGKYPRFIYGSDMIAKLIKDIINNRDNKITRYNGLVSYQNIMMKSKNEKSNNKGFWEQAYELAFDTNGNIVKVVEG